MKNSAFFCLLWNISHPLTPRSSKLSSTKTMSWETGGWILVWKIYSVVTLLAPALKELRSWQKCHRRNLVILSQVTSDMTSCDIKSSGDMVAWGKSQSQRWVCVWESPWRWWHGRRGRREGGGVTYPKQRLWNPCAVGSRGRSGGPQMPGLVLILCPTLTQSWVAIRDEEQGKTCGEVSHSGDAGILMAPWWCDCNLKGKDNDTPWSLNFPTVSRAGSGKELAGVHDSERMRECWDPQARQPEEREGKHRH